MASLNPDNLKLAIELLTEKHEGSVITAIQFEGISGTAFTYQVDGKASGWKYINFANAFRHARANDTYFTTLGRAIDYSLDTASIRGFTTMLSDFTGDTIVYGHTKHYHFELFKDGKVQRKQLHLAIYRMDSGTYELTHYIN